VKAKRAEKLRHASSSGDASSLTPALSRWERERRIPQRTEIRRARLPDALADFPPLPAGEGRGEGEQLEVKQSAPTAEGTGSSTRRQFVQATATATAFASFATPVLAQPAGKSLGTKTLKTDVLVCGGGCAGVAGGSGFGDPRHSRLGSLHG